MGLAWRMRFTRRWWLPISLILAVAAGAGEVVYSGRSPAGQADTEGYTYRLTLSADGHATLLTQRGPRSRLSELAIWTPEGNDGISLQFVKLDGRTRGEPTVWKKKGAQLIPLTWGKPEWNGMRPPTLSR